MNRLPRPSAPQRKTTSEFPWCDLTTASWPDPLMASGRLSERGGGGTPRRVLGFDQSQSSCFTKLQVPSSEKGLKKGSKGREGTRRIKATIFAPKNRIAPRWPAEGKHPQNSTHADGAAGAER